MPLPQTGAVLSSGSDRIDTLRRDEEFVLSRCLVGEDGLPVLMLAPASERPSPRVLERLKHEYSLRERLDPAWAARPRALADEHGRTVLLLEDPGGELLNRLPRRPWEVAQFIRVAIGIAVAIGRVHARGLVHKDVKPANILVNTATGAAWLTGFGIASRLPREHQSPEPPEVIAGTLAYIAPEQTGRMNRSVDSRSDLYALGATFYELLTGVQPFTASDPMEWVHCHIARQPVPPNNVVKVIPAPLSAIVLKLLAKTPEERYQTAVGLERDLRRCLSQFEAEGRIDQFALGERDTPDRLFIPEKLYGRAREVAALLAAFDRIVRGSAPELVLVSGYSGIGKSAVVNELYKVLVPPRGLFGVGKFDQYKRDIPYSTLAQAFQSLVRSLLAKSDAELGNWREALREALGPNGQLVVDLIPELELIIGEQMPVPELPPQDAQRRFQLVFWRFLAVFARPEHPLALFLDDLQWLDAATLDLLEELLSRADARNLLLIGAYRDNEVTPGHPLMRKLEAIRASGRVQDIKLAPLNASDLGDLVSESLRCDAEQAGALARLVHAKTDGNPFFVIQFLHVLADEGLLAFDHEQARWSWDLGGIHAKRYTDNVVELLAGKLTRLQLDTQNALAQLACLGNVAGVAMLSLVLEMPEEQVHVALWEAVRQQLIDRLERSYKFVHDRVQEAAYGLIPERSRAEAHLTIGRLLVRHTSPEKRDETIFEIVNQFNRGAQLIASQEERELLAELNLAAGKRAKASSAYASALTYLAAGAALLPNDAWERRHELAFALELHGGDCDICLGALQAAEERLAGLATRVVDTVQRCAVARRRVDLYTMLGASEHAVAVGLECLRHVGIDSPPRPTKAQARAEYERIWSSLGSGAIEDLVELPLMHDEESLAILDVLTVMTIPTHYTDENLHALIVSRAVNLCLERGNSDAAPVSYAAMGLIAGTRFGHHDEAYRFGKMACSLIERRGLKHFGAGRTYFNFAVLIPWKRPLKEAIDPARRAFQMGRDLGHPTFAALAGRTVVSILLASGHPLDQLEREAEEASEFVLPFGFFLDRISAPLALVRTLRGRTKKFGSLDDDRFTEGSFEQRLTGRPSYAFLECYYWIRKLQARFFAGDYASAVDAADKAERWYEASVALAQYLTEMADFHFYAALSRAACCDPMGTPSYVTNREALEGHERLLRGWAKNCPANFEDRAALVGAEIARVEGRELDAERLYEEAIRSARENGFVHNEALADELAGRFYSARGFETISQVYLRNARYCYLRWGADGKVMQLDELYPHLGTEKAGATRTDTVDTLVGQLDLATVIKVSQAVSGEMVLEKLLDTLMRTAMEHAGAQRALLLLSRGDKQYVVAEATSSRDAIIVQLHDEPVTGSMLPATILHYVVHTQESVLLDDAVSLSPFSTDPYIGERHTRSVLCLPLTSQAKLIGVLYLENNVGPRVFAPARTAVLKLLASQAAISLQNASLYTELKQENSERRQSEAALKRSEERYMLAVEAAGDGHADWIVATDELYASPRLLEMCGLSADATFSGRADFIARFPYHPEDRDRVQAAIEAHYAGRSTRMEIDLRIVRRGETRWMHATLLCSRDAAGAPLRTSTAFTDITERTRLERQLGQAQRLEAMGTLAGGIAHDFNNILGAILGFGEMAQRGAALGTRLRRDLDSIMTAGERGRALVDRILAFSRSGVEEQVPVHVERIVREALDHFSAKLPAGIRLETDLSAGRAAMMGDPTQVHQVLMNLASNATQAMPDGGTLRVSLKCERVDSARAASIGTVNPGEFVVLQVADSGSGIPPHILDRIFDPFFTTKEVGVGTGLGLSLVHSIVTQVGGAIDVSSRVGAGSVFTVFLPRSAEALEEADAEESRLQRGNRERVLVVDDEEPLVQLATRTLEELGYVPVGFTSSAAALAAFRADPLGFDALVTDERMPGVSGSALIRELRGIRAGIPILLVSGYVGGEVARRALEAGANEVLKKPLSARELATSLARVLQA